MMSRCPESVARSRVKTAIKHLTLTQRMRVIADVLRAIGLPMFALQITEHLSDE